MKFFEGDLKNAISNRKTFSSAFIVFVESKDTDSLRFRQLLDEENIIPPKEYIAFRISPPSQSYKHFLTIYREVPIPSLFIIGIDGEPIRILSSCESKADLYAQIQQALDMHKASKAIRRLDPQQNINLVQILLKLPRGETAVVEFTERSNLEEVKKFIKESLQIKHSFQMITPYPRKVFSPEDECKSLVELQLHPTSTILIVPMNKCKPWTPQCVSTLVGFLIVNIGRVFRTFKDWCSLLIPHRRI